MATEILRDLSLKSADTLSLSELGLGFLLSISLSYLVRHFYINYSSSLSGKHHIGNILPLLASIVFLVILVVKSSLALSLGLVGALSIVRFRTPIKEPEELAYIFLAIAIGLGNAAGYYIATSLVVVSIMLVTLLQRRFIGGRSRAPSEFVLTISHKFPGSNFGSFVDALSKHFSSLRLIRNERCQSTCTIVFSATSEGSVDIDAVVNSISDVDSESTITFAEPNPNW